jgi:hypothetical protein
MRSWLATAGTVSCLTAISLAAGPARAEEPGPAVTVAGLPKPATAPDPARLEEAKRHMKAGAAFYKDPSGHKCEEALREFRKAYELSGSINAIKGMAVCDLELERDGESIELYTTYLAGKRDTIDPGERAQVEADLAALRAAVARVSLTTNMGKARLIDVRTPARGYPVRNTYPLPLTGARLGVHPGQHVFTASVDGAPDQVWKVDIGNGGNYVHAFVFSDAATPPPPPVPEGEPSRPIPPSVFVTAGLTVALAVPWGVFAIRAKSLNDAYEGVNGKEPAAQLNDQRSDIKNNNLIADLFLGATLASLTATAVLFFTRPVVKRAGNFTPAGPRVMLGVSSHGGGVGVGVGASGWF